MRFVTGVLRPAEVLDVSVYSALPCFFLICCTTALAQEAPLTPKTLQAALAARPAGADAERLAERIRAYFGKNDMARGPRQKTDELTVAWAIEAPESAGTVRVVSEDGKFALPLVRVGSTNVYAGVATLPGHGGDALAVPGRRHENGRRPVGRCIGRDPDSRGAARECPRAR